MTKVEKEPIQIILEMLRLIAWYELQMAKLQWQMVNSGWDIERPGARQTCEELYEMITNCEKEKRRVRQRLDVFEATWMVSKEKWKE